MAVSDDWEELSHRFFEMFQGLIEELAEDQIARDLKRRAHCTLCGRSGIKLRCRDCEEKRRPEHRRIRSAGADSEYTETPGKLCVDCGRGCKHGLRCRDCGVGQLCFCGEEFCSLEEPHSSRCDRKRVELNLARYSYDSVKKRCLFNCFCGGNFLEEDSETEGSEMEESDVEASEPVKKKSCELIQSKL